MISRNTFPFRNISSDFSKYIPISEYFLAQLMLCAVMGIFLIRENVAVQEHHKCSCTATRIWNLLNAVNANPISDLPAHKSCRNSCHCVHNIDKRIAERYLSRRLENRSSNLPIRFLWYKPNSRRPHIAPAAPTDRFHPSSEERCARMCGISSFCRRITPQSGVDFGRQADINHYGIRLFRSSPEENPDRSICRPRRRASVSNRKEYHPPHSAR